MRVRAVRPSVHLCVCARAYVRLHTHLILVWCPSFSSSVPDVRRTGSAHMPSPVPPLLSPHFRRDTKADAEREKKPKRAPRVVKKHQEGGLDLEMNLQTCQLTLRSSNLKVCRFGAEVEGPQPHISCGCGAKWSTRLPHLPLAQTTLLPKQHEALLPPIMAPWILAVQCFSDERFCFLWCVVPLNGIARWPNFVSAKLMRV